MIKGIFALVFLAIVAIVLQTISIPSPFGLILYVILVLGALYILAVMLGLAPKPSWWGNGGAQL